MIKPTVNQLSKGLTLLRQKIYHPSDNLQGRVFAAYRQRIIQELTDLFLNNKPDLLIKKLRIFLAKNWQMVKNNSGTSLSYTALPDNEITNFLCDIAQLVKEASNNKNECTLQILMPTLVIDSISPDYPALDALDIRQVLKTHILGKEGQYLIPVDQLMTLQSTPPKKWLNCYYDFSVHQERMHLLNQEEYDRLGRHSPETIALRDAQLQYELSLNEQGSLLAHLKQLCRFLYFNSVNGIGKETNAGAGTYDAIIQFNEYYRRLDDTAKGQIPCTVKTEIDLILNLSTNKEVNKDATANLKTCIATRREELEKAIKPEENILAGIGLSLANKTLLTSEKKKHLDHCQISLKNALEKKKYAGRDSLGLTKDLIRTLNVELAITSLDDVREFMTLQPKELNELCQDEELQKQLISQFKNIETLVFFIHETPIAQLNVVLSVCAQRLAKKLVRNSEDFCALLITLNKERCQIICQFMKAHLIALIKKCYNFKSVLEPLQQDQRTIIYHLFEDRLPLLIKDGFDFNTVCSVLSSDQRDTIYRAMKTPWTTLIKNGFAFKKVLEVLSPVQRNDVYTVMSNHWLTLITRSHDFHEICKALSPDQHLTVYNIMQDRLPSLINHNGDLERIFQVLAAHQCIELCLAIKGRWSRMIRDRSDLENLLKELSPDNRITIYITMKKHIWSLIKQSYDFKCLQKLFSDNPIHLKIIYEDMKNHLPSIIKDINDVTEIFKLIPAREYSDVYKKIKAPIHEMIKDHCDLDKVFKTLSTEQCTAFCLAIKDQISKIIKDKGDLASLLKKLTLEQCTIFGTQIKDQLPKIIKGISDVTSILKSDDLTADKRNLFCTLMKDHLPNMIKNGWDFLQLSEASPEQTQTLFNAKKDHWPECIKSSADFSSVLIPLSAEQRVQVFNAMKMHLPTMIKNGSDFEEVLRYLAPAQRTDIYKMMENKLVRLIQSPSDFSNILGHLSPEQRTMIYQKMRRRLQSLIKTSSDFVTALEFLSPDQRTAVYLKKKTNLQSLLNEDEDFFWILSVLSPEQCTELCSTMNDYLLGKINDGRPDLTRRLEPLSLEQCTVVFKAIKDSILPELHSVNFNYLLQHLSPVQGTAFCRAIKNNLSTMGIEIRDFSIILEGLPIDKYIVVFIELKEQLAVLLKDSLDVKALLQPLSIEQCSMVCKEIKASLVACIKDSYDFEQVFEALSHEQQHVVYNALKDHLPLIIKNGQDFNRVCHSLPVERPHMLLEMTSHLTLIIKNSLDIKWVFQSLAPDECKLVMFTQTQLLPLLKNTQDLSTILKPLSITQCDAVCESMKSHLATIIKDKNDLATLLSSLPPNLYSTLHKHIKETFQHLVPVIELKEFLNTLHTDKQRKKVQQIFVVELLEKIRAKADKMDLDSNAGHVAYELAAKLANASRLYFVKEKTDYPSFKNLCQKAIKEATDLNYDFEWIDLLATLVLAILSFGVIPVANKLITGNWMFRLFKSNDELVVYDALDEANQLII